MQNEAMLQEEQMEMAYDEGYKAGIKLEEHCWVTLISRMVEDGKAGALCKLTDESFMWEMRELYGCKRVNSGTYKRMQNNNT